MFRLLTTIFDKASGVGVPSGYVYRVPKASPLATNQLFLVFGFAKHLLVAAEKKRVGTDKLLNGKLFVLMTRVRQLHIGCDGWMLNRHWLLL